MEKSKAIEFMRGKLKNRQRLLLLPMLLFIIFNSLNYFFQTNHIGNQHDVWHGFLAGLLASFGLMGIFMNIRIHWILLDEEKIWAAYLGEHDERQVYIRERVALPQYLTVIGILLVAALVSSFFSILVFYTLVAVILLISLVQCAYKIYLKQKFGK